MTDKIAERFDRETRDHEMTILHDDGLYRHLSFRNPKTFAYWFELITVPNALIFRGDGESYVFTRIEDMFAFFRDSSDWNRPRRINPSYWAEKVTSSRTALQEYQEELLAEYVNEALKEAEAEHPGVTKAWTKATDGFLPDYYTSTETEARETLDGFAFKPATTTCTCGASARHLDEGDAATWRFRHRDSHSDNPHAHMILTEPEAEFRFTDTYEWDLTDWHWWYLWACHAIVWGIAQYDAHKAAQTPAAAAAGGGSGA